MCPKSYALGLWRGSHLRRRDVPLCASICVRSYHAGFRLGRETRKA